MGSAAGLLPTPARYASGATQPIAVLVGDFVAGPTPDLAVGHADGTLTLLEGDGQGTFQLRPESTVTGLGTIADLTAADLDGDGDTDLAVSGTNQLALLLNDNDPLTTSPLANGDFSQGLTGWRTEIVGHASGATTGSIMPWAGSPSSAKTSRSSSRSSRPLSSRPRPNAVAGHRLVGIGRSGRRSARCPGDLPVG